MNIFFEVLGLLCVLVALHLALRLRARSSAVVDK